MSSIVLDDSEPANYAGFFMSGLLAVIASNYVKYSTAYPKAVFSHSIFYRNFKA
jgi:hypothetical protein